MGGPGMREMLAITGGIKGAGLGKDVLLVDRRPLLCGGTTGLCVGHVAPEAVGRRSDRFRPGRRPHDPRRRQPDALGVEMHDLQSRRSRAGPRTRRSTPAASSASTPRSCSRRHTVP